MSDVRNSTKETNERRIFKLKFFNSKNTSLVLLCFTILFALQSILIHIETNELSYIRLDYTNCRLNNTNKRTRFDDLDIFDKQRSTNSSSLSKRANSRRSVDSSTKTCVYKFTLLKDWNQMLYVHYHLVDYFKNFLTFAESYSKKQLFGDFSLEVLEQCAALTKPTWIDYERSCFFAPCGELPNFMFNDTFKLYYLLNGTQVPIRFNLYNITDTYFDLNFRNPYAKDLLKNLTQRPRNWWKNVFELDSDNELNNGYRNQRLIVWLYPNPFSDFIKLYGRITRRFDDQLDDYLHLLDHKNESNITTSKTNKELIEEYKKKIEERKSKEKSPYLRKGDYLIEINDDYPLWSKLSRKKFKISNLGKFGQENVAFKLFTFLSAIVCFLSMIIVYLIYRFHDEIIRLYIKEISDVEILF